MPLYVRNRQNARVVWWFIGPFVELMAVSAGWRIETEARKARRAKRAEIQTSAWQKRSGVADDGPQLVNDAPRGFQVVEEGSVARVPGQCEVRDVQVPC